MRKNKDTVKFNKIEVDEKTLEPKIVEISAEKFEKENADQTNSKAEEAHEIREVTHEEGKQIVMSKVFGVSENDKSINKRQKIFKYSFTAAFIILVVGVLVFTFLNDFIFSEQKAYPSGAELADIFSKTWFYFIFALIALFGCFFFKGFKMSLMCKSTTKKWHFKTCMETAIVGLYYNNVTPLAVGGQPFEIYHLSKHGVHGGAASSLPIAAYFLNQFGFVFLGLLSVIFFNFNVFGTDTALLEKFPTTFTVLALIGLFFCMLLPIIVIIFSLKSSIASKLVKLVMTIGAKLRIIKDPEASTAKTLKTVEHNAKCLKHIASSPLVFILSIFCSLAEHLSLASITYFTLRFFGFDIPENGFMEWLQIVQIALILYAAISFIPTPGNSGAADLSFYILFSFGITFSGGAFSAMIVWRILSFYSIIIIGFIFTSTKKRADRKKALIENANSEFTEYEVQQEIATENTDEQ